MSQQLLTRIGVASAAVICGGVIYSQYTSMNTMRKNMESMKTSMEGMKANTNELQKKAETYKAMLDKAIEAQKQLTKESSNYGTRVEKLKKIAPVIFHQVMEREITPFHESMIQFGLPSEENLHFYSSFISSTNYQKRIPNWVIQHITADDMSEDNVHADRKHSQFTGSVPHVPQEFQANNKDYFHSGWSRGHMVPAGDNRKSQEAMDDTFHLNNNIVPQNLHNNMHFWYRLEVFAKNTMTKQFDDVYVISGPAFLPTENEQKKKFVHYEVIGENNVAVPSHIFKVILVIPKNSSKNKQPSTHLLGAFLVPNERIHEDKILTDFEVPLEYLEKQTGLKFFKNLDRKTQVKPLCAYSSCQVMTEAQLTKWNYARQIDWAKTKKEAETAWADYQAKGYEVDDRIRKSYDRKLLELSNQQ